jgi:hypothetical protein
LVTILIAAADCENTGADHIGETVSDARPVAAIRDAARQPLGNPEAPFGQREKHDAAIGSEAPAFEGGGHFFA